jgi:hypothetical protein
MTDRHAGYIVTLGHDIREDDAEATVTALRQIKGVLNVTPLVADAEHHIAQQRAYFNIRNRVLGALELT